MHVSTSGLRPRRAKLAWCAHTMPPAYQGGQLTHRHRRVGFGRRENLVLAEVGKERPFGAEGRRQGEAIVAEVAPLELALAQIAPLGKGDRLVVVGAHRQGVAVDEILRQHVERGAIQVVRRVQIQILGEDFQQVRAALGDVVRQQLDAVDAHQREQRVVPPLEVGLAVLEFHGGQLAPQDLHEEVAAPARRLQKARVNALGLVLHQVEHGLDHPRRGEDLPVVGDALFGLDEVFWVGAFRVIPPM